MDLMQVMLQAMQAQQQPAQAGTKQMGGLARAMMARQGDAKFRGLAALPPYAESKHADSLGATPSSSQGAFQSDAFQNDAFQVS